MPTNQVVQFTVQTGEVSPQVAINLRGQEGVLATNSATESPTRPGVYLTDPFNDLNEDTYEIVITADDGSHLGNYEVYLLAEDGTYIAYEPSGQDADISALERKLTAPTVVYTNPTAAGNIRIIRGDAYDDTAWPRFSINFDKDVDGLNFTFTIRRKGRSKADPPELQVTGVGTGEVCLPSISSDDTINLEVTKQYTWDCEVEFSASSKQTLIGTCEVIEDLT